MKKSTAVLVTESHLSIIFYIHLIFLAHIRALDKLSVYNFSYRSYVYGDRLPVNSFARPFYDDKTAASLSDYRTFGAGD